MDVYLCTALTHVTASAYGICRHSMELLCCPMFLQLTNGPSAPRKCQLLNTPWLQPADIPDSCRKCSAPQIPAPYPQSCLRSPCFLYTALLSVSIQLSTSSGSHSWLPKEAAEVESLGSQHPRLSLQDLFQSLNSLQLFPIMIGGCPAHPH